MANRYYTAQAWLWTSRLVAGVAWVNLTDGRAGVVRRKDDGTWEYVLAGATTSGFANSEDAINALTSYLANERILLRRRE
jgi:hypothetical protein